jgi:hypothetical protein
VSNLETGNCDNKGPGDITYLSVSMSAYSSRLKSNKSKQVTEDVFEVTNGRDKYYKIIMNGRDKYYT